MVAIKDALRYDRPDFTEDKFSFNLIALLSPSLFYSLVVFFSLGLMPVPPGASPSIVTLLSLPELVIRYAFFTS